MKKFFLTTIILTALIFAGQVFACEPCGTEMLSFEQTVERADLIIVGNKVGEGPLSGPETPPDTYGPDWINVEVEQVLKGEEGSDAIKVNSWSGMCAYGIVIDDEASYIIFLEDGYVDDTFNEGDVEMYDSVQWGCSTTKLPLTTKRTVFVEGEEFTIDEFGKKYIPGHVRPAPMGGVGPDDQVQNQAGSVATCQDSNFPAYIILAVILILFILLVVTMIVILIFKGMKGKDGKRGEKENFKE